MDRQTSSGHNDSSASQPDPDAASAVTRTSRMSGMNIAADMVRHVVPLLPLYIFNGNFASYLLLTAFDLSLGLMQIVGTTRDRRDPTSVDPRSRWLLMRLLAVPAIAVFLAIFAAIIALPIVAPAFIFGLSTGVDWLATVSDKRFWIPVVGMSLLAAARAQGAFEATTAPGRQGEPSREGPVIGDLEQDRKRSLADKAAQVTLIATFVGLCYLLITSDAGAYTRCLSSIPLCWCFTTRDPIWHNRFFPSYGEKNSLMPPPSRRGNLARPQTRNLSHMVV